MGNCQPQHLTEYCQHVEQQLDYNTTLTPSPTPSPIGSTYCNNPDLPTFMWIDNSFIAVGIVGTFCLTIMAIGSHWKSQRPDVEPFQRKLLVCNCYLMAVVTFAFMASDFIEIIVAANKRKDNIFQIWLCELPIGNVVLILVVVQLFCNHLSINITRLIYEVTHNVELARRYFGFLLQFHSFFYFVLISIAPFPLMMLILVIMDYVYHLTQMILYIIFIIADGICFNIRENQNLRRNWWGFAAVVIHMISILPILILRALQGVNCTAYLRHGQHSNAFTKMSLCILTNNIDAIFAFGLIMLNIWCWFKVIVNTPVSFVVPSRIQNKYKDM